MNCLCDCYNLVPFLLHLSHGWSSWVHKVVFALWPSLIMSSLWIQFMPRCKPWKVSERSGLSDGRSAIHMFSQCLTSTYAEKTHHPETGTQRRIRRGEQKVAAHRACGRFGKVLRHTWWFNAPWSHLKTNEIKLQIRTGHLSTTRQHELADIKDTRI